MSGQLPRTSGEEGRGGGGGAVAATSETRRRPRLLCLLQLPPPVHGGTIMNEHVVESAALAERFVVDVLPLRFASSIDDIGRVSLRKIGKGAAVALRLARALLASRPDAVYYTLAPAGAAFYRDCVYVGIIKTLGVPRIYHMHGSGVARRLDVWWRRALYRWVFRGAGVIHVSRRLEADTAAVADGPVRYVANGLPDVPAPPAPPAGPRSVPRVLFLSTVVEEKGPFVLVQALRQLTAANVAFEATFAGEPGTPGRMPAFREGLARLGAGDRVRYIGPVYGAAKESLYREHDLFVLPSFREACPLVVLEAMRAGLPVIATSVGAVPEMVEDGRSGCLVAAGDAEALAARIGALLGDEATRRRMGARGRELYLERYTLERFEGELAAALESFMPDGAGARRPVRAARERPLTPSVREG